MRISLGYHVLIITSMLFQNALAKKIKVDNAPTNMVTLEGSIKAKLEEPAAAYWLPITVKNNQHYVLVSLYPHALNQRPKIDPQTGKNNFYFCDTKKHPKNDSLQGLPRGLYHWKGDEDTTARHRPRGMRYHYHKESGRYKRRGAHNKFWHPYKKDEPFVIDQLKKLT